MSCLGKKVAEVLGVYVEWKAMRSAPLGAPIAGALIACLRMSNERDESWTGCSSR